MNAPTRVAIFGRTLCAAVILCLASGAAVAQDEPGEVEKQWALKAGGFFPTQGRLRSQSASPYYVVGLEYDPNLKFKLANGRITLGAEFMYRENSGRFLTIPLTARVKWNIHQMQPETNIYGGIGAGLYIINTRFEGNELQPGVRFSAGLNMNERWFVEMNYDLVSGFTDNLGNGIRNDGISLLLGYRY